MPIHRDECITRLGDVVNDSKRMILKIKSSDRIHIESEFFNYEDIQRLTYILQRTACEWWIYPISEKSVELRVRLF